MGFNREFEINENQVADFLNNATEKVRTTEDVDVLTDLCKLFKQNVPLTVRKYVIAYMLKDALKHYHSFGNNHRNGKNRNDFRQQRAERAPAVTEETVTEERVHHERVTIPEDQATSIFISIGKNRRVYPRDLVGILIAIAGLERDRIGDIKVLANYSFVQLYSADAPIAIEKLNGYDYRGRKLAVSYSRQKSDEEATEEVQEAEDSSINDAENQEISAEDAAAYAAAEKAAADKEPFGV